MQHSKILYLIDDDNDDLDIFTEAVKIIDKSIVCLKSNNSETVLQSFKKHLAPVPDLIFLDLNMPLVSGKEFLSQIKSIEPYSKVPVVIYSTSSYPGDIKETKRLGAAYFLTKPYSMAELIKNLNELLKKMKLHN